MPIAAQNHGRSVTALAGKVPSISVSFPGGSYFPSL